MVQLVQVIYLHESAIRALHRKNILKDVGDEENWVMILIDDIVAGNGDEKKPSESYKKSLKDIFTNELRNVDDDNVEQTLNKLFENPSPEQLKQFSDAYVARKGIPCKPYTNDKNSNCDNYNDNLLENSISQGKNVVIEMRGLYKPDWVYDVLRDNQGKKIYNVVLKAINQTLLPI